MDETTQSVVVKLLAHKVDSLEYESKDQERLIASYQERIESLGEELVDLRDRNESLTYRIEARDSEISRLRFDNQQFMAEYNRRNAEAEKTELLKADPADFLPPMEMTEATEILDAVLRFLGRNEKIPAIKWLRERLHDTKGITFGLKEAKDYVDCVQAHKQEGTLPVREEAQ